MFLPLWPHYDVTQFEYVSWRHRMHEWVMNIHYQTWIAQGRFTNMILIPSKQWGVCDIMTEYKLMNCFSIILFSHEMDTWVFRYLFNYESTDKYDTCLAGLCRFALWYDHCTKQPVIATLPRNGRWRLVQSHFHRLGQHFVEPRGRLDIRIQSHQPWNPHFYDLTILWLSSFCNAIPFAWDVVIL